MRIPLPMFTAPGYGDRTLNEVQRCVNFHPAKTPQGFKLVADPGLASAYTVTGNEPSRGWYKASTGSVYSVHGDKLYQLTTVAATELGTLDGSLGPVYFADNGETLLICAGPTSYVMPFATTTLAAIADVNFVGHGYPVTCIDGYFVSTDGRDFYLSALGDPADWTPVTADAPDPQGGNIEYLCATSDRLILFSTRAIEQWYNTGNADFIFERVTGSTVNLGYSGAFAARGNTFYFQAQGDGVDFGYYEMGPNGLRKISTPYIDGFGLIPLSAFCYEHNGHAVYQVNGAVSSFCYDIEGGYWWEKSSINGSGNYSRHRLLAIINRQASAPSPLALDADNGNVYLLSQVDNSEGGTAIRRIRAFGPIEAGARRLFHHSIRFVLEIDHDSTASYTLSADLDWTDDGGLTWSTARTLSKAITSGTTGQRVMLEAHRLGSSRQRYYRLTFTGPSARIVLQSAELEADVGSN